MQTWTLIYRSSRKIYLLSLGKSGQGVWEIPRIFRKTTGKETKVPIAFATVTGSNE